MKHEIQIGVDEMGELAVYTLVVMALAGLFVWGCFEVLL